MIYIILFIFGSVVGSFLNVLIYRMPRNEKIGLSRSRCTRCKSTIAWFDNIPFFSYIFLRGKCRKCKEVISFKYFIVEFITAFMLCLLWWKFSDPVLVAVYFVFISILIAASFIDLEFFIIPDELDLGGLIIGLISCAIFPQLMNENIWYKGLLKSFLGALIGGGTLYIIAVTATAILKKEAMGMGDVKLLAMIGSIIGWKWALFTIFTGSLFGTVGGLFLILLNKTDIKGKIPFGPYLAMGAVVSLFWAKDIMNWYGGLLLFTPKCFS